MAAEAAPGAATAAEQAPLTHTPTLAFPSSGVWPPGSLLSMGVGETSCSARSTVAYPAGVGNQHKPGGQFCQDKRSAKKSWCCTVTFCSTSVQQKQHWASAAGGRATSYRHLSQAAHLKLHRATGRALLCHSARHMEWLPASGPAAVAAAAGWSNMQLGVGAHCGSFSNGQHKPAAQNSRTLRSVPLQLQHPQSGSHSRTLPPPTCFICSRLPPPRPAPTSLVAFFLAISSAAFFIRFLPAVLAGLDAVEAAGHDGR